MIRLLPQTVQTEADRPAVTRLVPVEGRLVRGEAAHGSTEDREVTGERLLANDVHRSGQRILAVQEPAGALEHLDAANVVHLVVADLGLGGAVGHDQTARDRVETANREELVHARAVLDVEATDVFQRVPENFGILFVDQRLADRAHEGWRHLQRSGQLCSYGVRRRKRRVLDRDVLDELAPPCFSRFAFFGTVFFGSE